MIVQPWGCSTATHGEVFAARLWFSVFALSTRVKHQRRELTILTLNRSLCLFWPLGSHCNLLYRSLPLSLSLSLSLPPSLIGLVNEEREVMRSKWIFSSLKMIMSQPAVIQRSRPCGHELACQPRVSDEGATPQHHHKGGEKGRDAVQSNGLPGSNVQSIAMGFMWLTTHRSTWLMDAHHFSNGLGIQSEGHKLIMDASDIIWTAH